MQSSPCSLQLEKAHPKQWRPSSAKEKEICRLKKKKKKPKKGTDGKWIASPFVGKNEVKVVSTPPHDGLCAC